MSHYRYQTLVSEFAQEIAQGRLPPGERLPSIRDLAKTSGFSKTTVITAYSRLESMGLIESHPKSGFFVRAQPFHSPSRRAPSNSPLHTEPAVVSINQVILDIMEQAASFDLLPGIEQWAGNIELRRCLSRAQRSQGLLEQHYYDEPQGLLALREQIASRTPAPQPLKADEVVITHGCQHALLLALMATTQAGDIVAIESPGFYGAIQLLDTLGLRAIELASSPDTGLDLAAFEAAIKQWPIKSLITAPNFATPTGAMMPEAAKRNLLSLCISHGITVIEDDVYSELYFGPNRPRSLFTYDTTGNVILCSSFSKALSRDLRVGWILPGMHLQRVKQLKVVTSIASSTTTQRGISLYMAQGGCDRHLKKRRSELQRQATQWLNAVREHVPSIRSCSNPRGGLAFWAELPPRLDSLDLYSSARKRGIILTPGPLFSPHKRYRNYLRLSFSEPLTEKRRQALCQLQEIISARSGAGGE